MTNHRTIQEERAIHAARSVREEPRALRGIPFEEDAGPLWRDVATLAGFVLAIAVLSGVIWLAWRVAA